MKRGSGSHSIGRVLRVGTRGSRLALVQTNLVIEALPRCDPGLRGEVVIIRTRGDDWQGTDWPVQLGTGVFVREIEQALLRGDIDLAVHSLKDLPAQLPEGLVFAAVLERADPREVLVGREGKTLRELPARAVVGTGSPRRRIQLSSIRPDLQIIPIRGNVPTRLDRVSRGEVDGVVLAAAGLLRLGLGGQASEYFSPERVVPAVGQGALVVEARAGEGWESLLEKIHHEPTDRAIRCERSFLESWGGGCRVPLGAYAQLEGERLQVLGMVERDSELKRAQTSGSSSEPERLGRQLAGILRGER